MKYYTGIGSRETPSEIMELMRLIAQKLYEKKYILRSGGAEGADSAFEEGAITNKEIFLPWNGFNNRWFNNLGYFPAHPEAWVVAQRLHPFYDTLKQGAKRLHDRNVCQVLGRDLQTPSKFVICYTSDGANGKEIPCTIATGGTGTAIKLAAENNIKILNLKNQADLENVKKKLKL
jgi:hypothetical protein